MRLLWWKGEKEKKKTKQTMRSWGLVSQSGGRLQMIQTETTALQTLLMQRRIVKNGRESNLVESLYS